MTRYPEFQGMAVWIDHKEYLKVEKFYETVET